MPDDVQLTDLEVIQRYSLAVRGATADRAELVAALEADLAWLSGRSRRTGTAQEPPAAAPAAKAVAKKVAKRAPAKRVAKPSA